MSDGYIVIVTVEGKRTYYGPTDQNTAIAAAEDLCRKLGEGTMTGIAPLSELT